MVKQQKRSQSCRKKGAHCACQGKKKELKVPDPGKLKKSKYHATRLLRKQTPKESFLPGRPGHTPDRSLEGREKKIISFNLGKREGKFFS